ncbi:hypothetical protein PV325_012769 [Microctonus aethiopoides]|nr:hypothetical protein PV325_012769 [Microctonus aethiopoides]
MKFFMTTIVIYYFILVAHAAILPSGIYDGEIAMDASGVIQVIDEGLLPVLKRQKRVTSDLRKIDNDKPSFMC